MLLVNRIAQHSYFYNFVLATKRSSVDVITGLIKAKDPTMIDLTTSSIA